jgi:hypothetical protein
MLYVQKGSIVNAGWSDSLAISANGSSWSTYRYTTISAVIPVFIANTGFSAANPSNETNTAEVHLKMNNGSVIKLNLNNIANQAGWLPTQVGTNQCVSDISSWISSSSD